MEISRADIGSAIWISLADYDLIQAVFLEYREEINNQFNVDEEFIRKFNLGNY